MKLGIIQSRGLGDIVIALPIARHYYDQGYEVHWPICREFITHFEAVTPWITWHPVETDHGSFFLEQPRRILAEAGVDLELPLYQALTGEHFHETSYFQHTGFDQYKYIRAGVPFLNKWQLKACLTRNTTREQELYDLVVKHAGGLDYILVHLDGSDHRAEFDTDILPRDIPVIEITALTDNLFDWLLTIERAWSVIMVDSVYSNLTDQLGYQSNDSRYLIPRSHIGLTPTLGHHWHWLDNLALNQVARTIKVAG